MTIGSTKDQGSPTLFFLPGTASSGQEAEYVRLRECALSETGCPPNERRIRMLSCRVAGRDCTIEVGQPDPVAGTAVIAILDLGRNLPYGVYTTADADAPALLAEKPVYGVTDFA